VSGVDLELDMHLCEAELAWRRAYEASIVARGDYQSLAARGAGADILDLAEERLDRAEALKARIMLCIERLEDTLLGNGGG
jgi:hypothetical protein